jgi:catechol 2,3-dioxygenase-like lactoylglutathione lyase family enzyme
MKLLELTLRAADLDALEAFYGRVLGLNIFERDASRLIVQVGRSRLVFVFENDFAGRYHVAFDVPNNQLKLARAWLEVRVPLMRARDGATEFHGENWNADQFYFLDPAGNILELIARHTADTASNTPFSSESLMAITEIGLASPDVPATIAWFHETINLEPYKDHSDTFTPVGDESSLLIVVAEGREWFPDTGVQSAVLPTEIVLEGEHPGEFNVPGLPCRVRVVQARA